MYRKLTLIVAVASVGLVGCTTTQLEKLQQYSANYQAAVASINASIAASAPLVAKGCGDLQTLTMLIAPLIPTNAKAPQYFSAANGALTAYCQAIPNDVNGTAAALAKAIAAARNGYYNVTGKTVGGI